MRADYNLIGLHTIRFFIIFAKDDPGVPAPSGGLWGSEQDGDDGGEGEGDDEQQAHRGWRRGEGQSRYIAALGRQFPANSTKVHLHSL